MYLLKLLLASILLAVVPCIAAILISVKQCRKQLKKLNASVHEQLDKLIIGFFHPYCNAGGGGERVLWVAIEATQKKYENSICIVYSGDLDATAEEILDRAKSCFNCDIDRSRVQIQFLQRRYWVEAQTWPRFTLIGQSLGSIILAFEAISLLPPDIFIDTMGYAFTYPLVYYLLGVPVVAYVHYPTISSDMFGRLNHWQEPVKFVYWKLFYALYSVCGRYANSIMTNSSWTQNHIKQIWRQSKAMIVYPPCDTSALKALDLTRHRDKNLVLMVSQYRPEKKHQLMIDIMKSVLETNKSAKLVFIGTSRGEKDLKFINGLKNYAKDSGLSDDQIQFQVNLPWSEVLEWYQKASVGVNVMTDEHFGIGVVEYQASGLITIVHKSGGPYLDIVRDTKYHKSKSATGFIAANREEFIECISLALKNPDVEMRGNARENSNRFSQESFTLKWNEQMELACRSNKLL